MSNTHDEWKATWDWARELWGYGESREEELAFHWFFGKVASEIAEAEGWDEVGSSDVWHASYHTVKRLKESGEVTTRMELVKRVLDGSGYIYGRKADMMAMMYGEPGALEGFQRLFAPA